ncbi:MAG: DUF370 domain-containing protein [Clostridia bacterium]|nr:DUF370 domain-containing protein [Clostridia bacterium]
MYVHIGEGKVLKKSQIVAVFDLDFSSVSVHTRNFLNKAQREKRVIALGYNLPKTFILTRDNLVYLSPLSIGLIK